MPLGPIYTQENPVFATFAIWAWPVIIVAEIGIGFATPPFSFRTFFNLKNYQIMHIT